MENDEHFARLKNMYSAAPINEYYRPSLTIEKGLTEIEMQIDKKYFHAAQAVHGSVYFKLLDDAAFFAANSLEKEFFVLTTSFTTYLTRPISSGTMRAVGKVVNNNSSQFIAEAVVYNDENKEIGRGNGLFIRSKMKLSEVLGYNVLAD